MRKLTLLLGIGIGYVLGARAGQQRYEEIKAQASRAWNSPAVQEKAAQAQEKVKETAPKVGEKASEVASTVAAKVKKDDEGTGTNADPSGTPIADGLAQPGSSAGV
ncbi:YtxH domain-containing protein [Nocardioides sp. ChNu-153]|uniref:hypothetical protein n=1 Tax=unclassified Nocardioides TaxID=2615069 RepID=UPI0024051453|nr:MULTISPECIES: hypothetical protein [unclassified Nocardioides]MDF9715306.1 hypothetical protein [Nocardioides sp. ChNu-99]MDN7122483.1 YtxH domain-containing protein [Nocardioides sp. ChNu-153]